jgi:hypothetical protein
MKHSQCFHPGERTTDFAALKVFKAVVDEGGFNSAARKLRRVQSNVTTRIQQVEAPLGTALFVRDRRRLYLTPAGELFLGFAEQMLDLSEQARSAFAGRRAAWRAADRHVGQHGCEPPAATAVAQAGIQKIPACPRTTMTLLRFGERLLRRAGRLALG